ncbi:ankyrin repeat domain-containing protein [Sorangium sp. So ce131]|uniref:ankyrin repeat domain-containing protein n=1 Tax=Sorangium sp. So ce131 TaxID=3133282 RepID=UPI003F621D2E
MEHPFKFGALYRVRKSFRAPRDEFNAGDTLVYWRDAYSHHEGMRGYFFRVPGSGGVRSWDVSAGEDVGVWAELFQQVSAPARLVVAAEGGDVAEARAALLEGGAPVDSLTVELAAEKAVLGGHAAVVELFLGAGALSPAQREIALHLAAGAGRAAIVRALLAAGAAADALDGGGQTPLIHAACSGDAETVAALLDGGADAGFVARSGVTPRSLAAARSHGAVVALLERAGAQT